MSFGVSSASFSAALHGSMVRSIRSATRDSSLARVMLDVEVLRAALIGGDEGQVHVGLRRGRQFDLCLLGCVLQPLQREPILAQVDALLLAELIRQELHDALVEVLAAKECVAIGGADLEHAFADLKNRDVEGSAAEVVDGDPAGSLLSPDRRPRQPRSAR